MTRVAIVGGGIIGVGIAHALRGADAEVVLLEKGALGSGTTSASVALFSWPAVPPDRFGYDLRREAWAAYEPLVERGELSYTRTGALLVAESPERRAALEEAVAAYDAYDLRVEFLEPAALADHNISPEGTTGALYVPEEGYLDPHEIIQRWVGASREAGVDVRTGVEVTAVDTADGAVAGVETTDGPMAADVVINAAGPWAPALCEQVGLDLPLRHTRGRILVLERDEPFSLPYTLFEDGVYFREEGRSSALAGRLEKAYPDAERLDPDHPPTVEEAFYRQVADRAERSVPILDDADVSGDWVGLRTVTPDKWPLLGPTALDGFLVAAGLSGLGVTLAPVVADRLAAYVTTGDPTVIPDGLAVDRFDG